MKCLVTGGAGFLGSAMVRKLLKDGHDVVVVDNMFDPTFRVQGGDVYGLLEFFTEDVVALNRLDIGNIDCVFHFAAHYANERSLAEPMKCVMTNMLGTMAVLKFCRARDVKVLMYASSSGVYGAMDIVAYAENQPPRPSTPYEVTKYSGELLCSGFCKIYGISLVAPRFFNVYGPGDVPGKWRAVVPNFFSLALRDEPIVVTGATASRDFTYVDDVVESIMAGVKRVQEGPAQLELVYNVSTGRETFIKDLAGHIVAITGSASKVRVEEFRKWDNAPRRVGDVHKFRSLFPDIADKMVQVFGAEGGLAKSIQWYKSVCSKT